MPTYIAVTMGVGEGGACLMKKKRVRGFGHTLINQHIVGGGDNAWDKMIR